MSGVAFVEMGTNFSFGAMLPFLCFDEIFPTMHRVEHRQLAAHRTHGPVVSNVFHCKRPSSIIPSLFHLLRKSHYDYATEPFFDLLDTRTSSRPYPRDSGRRLLSDHARKSLREKVPSSRFDLSFTGICGAMLFALSPTFVIGERGGAFLVQARRNAIALAIDRGRVARRARHYHFE